MPNAAKEKIIVALDVPTVEEARKHIDELRGEVGAFKIGLQLFTSGGAGFVREVVKSDIKLFLDLKFHDIPVTVAKASIEAARLGVWMFNVHASGGSEMMKRTVDSVREVCSKEDIRQPKIIGVTVLTSSEQATLQEIGIETEVKKQVVNLADLAYSSGLDGVVASPNEAEMIRESVATDDFLIVTPGVRLRSVERDDQKRVMTPGQAISNGANYLVIGRPILCATNKIDALHEIIANIETSRKTN